MTTATVPMMAASVATATTAALGVVVSALSGVTFFWRCRNLRCRKIICELEWNGRAVHRHKCSCNTETMLPEHAVLSLRTDRSKW